jgi:hypothetical protein
MRKGLIILLVGMLLAAFSIPLFADELPLPLEKDILPGVTYVTYAGQNFRFETTVVIHVSLIPRDFNLIELRFKSARSTSNPSIPAMGVSPNAQISINWENWNSVVYSGSPPPNEWQGLLHTESGFTEK